MRRRPGENVPQSAPLALIPYGAISCTLEQFKTEAAAAGVPNRLTYSVIGDSELGRDIFGVVVNALETPEQQAAYARWQQLRGLMRTDPAAGQSLLAFWGRAADVKLPIFVEANIHGGEREGTDAMMQAIRDLVTLPYGTNDTVDELLDHAIVVVIPTTNPDGRVAGRRQNENRFDLNRDLLVQSQLEIRANTAFQLQWLAPVGLFMHGYYNPTLVDGLTKPHNPGLEYDKFLYWNQRRLDANEAAIEAIGRAIQRPVNQWDQRGISGSKNGGPDVAEGWDDWGPFYSQTYGAFFGVDGSTVEMCNDAACGGRLGSKREQYLDLLLVGPVLAREQKRDPRRSAGDLPARRHRRRQGELLRRPVGRRPGLHGGPAQLDGRVPQGLRDPVRRRSGRPGFAASRGSAERRRGESSRGVAAPERRPGGPDPGRRGLGRDDIPGRLLRRLDEAGLPRLCVYRPDGRAGHLRADQPALRAAGRLESRVALGR